MLRSAEAKGLDKIILSEDSDLWVKSEYHPLRPLCGIGIRNPKNKHEEFNKTVQTDMLQLREQGFSPYVFQFPK